MSLGQVKTNTIIMPPPGEWKPVAAAPLRNNPGIVHVAMDPRPTMRGALHLPEEVTGHIMPNSGTVVAIGKNTDKWRGTCPPVRIEVAVGDRVLVLPFAGTRYRRLRLGDWFAKDVRMYGLTETKWKGIAQDGDQGKFEHYTQGVVAKMDGMTLKPLNDWIVIKRDPRVTESGLVHVLDGGTLNSQGKWKGTVVAASDKAIRDGIDAGTSLDVGSRVIYHEPSSALLLEWVTESDFEAYGFSGDPKDYLIIRHTQIYSVIEP